MYLRKSSFHCNLVVFHFNKHIVAYIIISKRGCIRGIEGTVLNNKTIIVYF
jgi:hypothetical protein